MNQVARSLTSMAFLAALLTGQTWTPQGPRPTNVSLNAVDFVDANTGWVAGGNGMDGGIWHTSDAGRTWQVQLENTGFDVLHIWDLQMLDTNMGWAVGNANMGSFSGVGIYRTTDGGATWLEGNLPPPPPGVNVVAATKIQFISASAGFVSTRPSAGISHLYRTTDGGVSWHYLRAVDLDSWHFLDAKIGWAATSNHDYIRTNDGGLSWRTVQQPVPGSQGSAVSHVFSYDEAVVRTLAGSPLGLLVHRTIDGGRSWTAASGDAFAEQYFLDGQRGWAINKGISKTTDGGNTWSTLLAEGELPETPWHMSIVDLQTLYVAGDFGLLMRSTDGGTSWDQVSNGTGRTLTAVRFVNHDVGWAVGDGFTALRTEDGGHTWRHQNTDLNVFTTAASPRRLWAFSERSAIVQLGTFGFTHSGFIATDDGGQTWTKQTSWPLGQGYFQDRQRGWLVNREGTTMWTTVDGGNNWTARSTGISPPFTHPRFTTDVFFIDDQHGWLIAVGYRAYRTTNGGQTWTSIVPQSAISGNYTRIMFADRDHGWLVADHGMIMRTTDGGTSWIDQTIPNSIGEPVLDLVVIGPEEAYISSGDVWNGFGSLLGGFVRHTTDGGATWPYEGSELHDGFVESVAVIGGDLWTVGTDGFIFHSPGVRGDVRSFGSGCLGSNNQVPSLEIDEEPIMGRNVVSRLSGVFGATTAVLAMGGSNTSWGTAALPLNLAFLGAGATCSLLVAPDVPVPVAVDASGQAESTLALPYDANLLGMTLFWQAVVLDPRLSTPLAVAVSPGLAIRVGGR